jgi:rfaE bifunctional protein nucleotidyltransferase chain/domain
MKKKNFFKNKIYNPFKLKKILKKKKFSLCHGVFDVLHIGHINYFKEAKKISGILVVSVTDDEFVNKGPGRPYFKINDRIEILNNISFIDYIIVNKEKTAINIIKLLKPSFYVKGPDYKKNSNDVTKNIYKEINEVKKNGGTIHYTKTELFSSTNIINNILLDENNKTNSFFSKIKLLTNYENLIKKIEELKNLTIFMIGDSIIDEYIFADPLNKSAKDTVLNFKISHSEKYLGGVLSIANNVSAFCKKVILVTKLSNEKKLVKFILNKLNKNIELVFINDKNSNIIIKKTRIIDKSSNQKQIGLHRYPENSIEIAHDNKLLTKIKEKIKLSNGIIISDFGHGLLSDKILRHILNYKRLKIAANSQINSANIGFHTLKKYNDIECLCMNYFELQHETRSYKGDIKLLSKQLAKKLKIKKLFVTNGPNGSSLYNKKTNKLVTAPGLKFNVIDRTGSGDTYFSMAALTNFIKTNDSESIYLSAMLSFFNLKHFANKEKVNIEDFKKVLQYSLK